MNFEICLAPRDLERGFLLFSSVLYLCIIFIWALYNCPTCLIERARESFSNLSTVTTLVPFMSWSNVMQIYEVTKNNPYSYHMQCTPLFLFHFILLLHVKENAGWWPLSMFDNKLISHGLHLKKNTELEGNAQHDIQKARSRLIEVNSAFGCLLWDITAMTNACTSWHLQTVILTNESCSASEICVD